ncbi:MAG: RNA recognition motif domain-containing protein [Burkholderiales bacterium]
MAKLWIGNIAPDTSDEELKALLVKYGFPQFDGIQHVPGDGSRPAAMVTFEATDAMKLQQLQPRVHNLFWKNRRLNVEVISGSRWNT